MVPSWSINIVHLSPQRISVKKIGSCEFLTLPRAKIKTSDPKSELVAGKWP
uniref:Uncharacterized protein n=2 Tax=Rhizophora mucronata TaxID=61149 RepID=A0A2P2JXM2_RHIMU